MKVGVWYLSVTFLLIMIGFIIVRLFVFGACWIAGYDFWILPNFFDEEASIMQSVTARTSAVRGESDPTSRGAPASQSSGSEPRATARPRRPRAAFSGRRW